LLITYQQRHLCRAIYLKISDMITTIIHLFIRKTFGGAFILLMQKEIGSQYEDGTPQRKERKRESVWERCANRISKKFIFFCKRLIFFVYFRSFWGADVKINFFKNKKHHFDAFRHEKYFEKQLQPHSQHERIGKITFYEKIKS